MRRFERGQAVGGRNHKLPACERMHSHKRSLSQANRQRRSLHFVPRSTAIISGSGFSSSSVLLAISATVFLWWYNLAVSLHQNSLGALGMIALRPPHKFDPHRLREIELIELVRASDRSLIG